MRGITRATRLDRRLLLLRSCCCGPCDGQKEWQDRSRARMRRGSTRLSNACAHCAFRRFAQHVDFVHCACAQQLPPVTNDNTIRLDLNDAVVTARESREAPGQNGNNCGYKNTELFGAGWNNLHVVAANAALEYAAFAEHYAAHSNRYCKRKRGEQSKPTAQDVAAYHRKGRWATNLTMALLAKGLRCDLYVATRDGQQRTMVTLYSADATLDGDAPLGQGLTSQEEVQPPTPVCLAVSYGMHKCACLRPQLQIFAEYKGPVLLHKGNDHWSAYPLRNAILGARAERALARTSR